VEFRATKAMHLDRNPCQPPCFVTRDNVARLREFLPAAHQLWPDPILIQAEISKEPEVALPRIAVLDLKLLPPYWELADALARCAEDRIELGAVETDTITRQLQFVRLVTAAVSRLRM
jgi:hypothetical protein